MNMSATFVKLFFFALCMLLSVTSAITLLQEGEVVTNVLIGLCIGVAFCLTFAGIDRVLKNINLKTFNMLTLGLLFGYLMGEAVFAVLNTVLNMPLANFSPLAASLLKAFIFLLSIFCALRIVTNAADQLYVCLPFIKFKPSAQTKKDIILDHTVLLDARLIDLASSGLLDQHLIVPRFIVKEMNEGLESEDEVVRNKSRRALEVLRKLEGNQSLQLRYIDTDFNDTKEDGARLVRLARMNDANIFTADANRSQQLVQDGVKIININALSNALKPLAQMGEQIQIKVQRYGKEPRQGVGYLEDGTMVVINGGAIFIGEIIKAQVLSVKHTSSGRMIFCNAADEGYSSENESVLIENTDQSQHNYSLYNG